MLCCLATFRFSSGQRVRTITVSWLLYSVWMTSCECLQSPSQPALRSTSSLDHSQSMILPVHSACQSQRTPQGFHFVLKERSVLTTVTGIILKNSRKVAHAVFNQPISTDSLPDHQSCQCCFVSLLSSLCYLLPVILLSELEPGSEQSFTAYLQDLYLPAYLMPVSLYCIYLHFGNKSWNFPCLHSGPPPFFAEIYQTWQSYCQL